MCEKLPAYWRSLLVKPLLDEAYSTTFSDGARAEIAHTFRVATAKCSHCGERGRLFPHALVSLKVRRERKNPEAFLACPAGHLFEGQEGRVESCPTCGRMTDPSNDYTSRRSVICWSCGKADRLETRAKSGSWQWEVVLVERSKDRERELAIARRSEVILAECTAWEPTLTLSEIPDGQETRVLKRHGFACWHDLYPCRQRVLLERLLDSAADVSDDEQVMHTLRLAIIGSAETAGHLS